MNTSVEERNGGQSVAVQRAQRVVSPRCDIHESGTSFFVTAEMPGVDAAAVDVTVERNVLTVSGRATPIEAEGMEPVWREFEPVDYRRSFALSDLADVSAIRANVKNGLVRIEVPKRVPTQHKIQVTGG